MTTANEFRRGDIMELNIEDGEGSTNQYKSLVNLRPDRVTIIRRIDADKILVAMCKWMPGRHTTVFSTNVGDIYVYAKSFYAVDQAHLKYCGEYLLNSHEVVDTIYKIHNQWIECARRKREDKIAIRYQQQERTKQKNAVRMRIRRAERKKQHELELRYKEAYDFAIINNNKEEMKKIQDIVGHPPCQSSKGYASASGRGKMSNKHFNPKPLSGGRFSPK